MLKKTVYMALAILVIAAAFPVWGQNKQNVKGMEVVIGNFWMDHEVNTEKPKNDFEETQLEQRKKLLQDNGVIVREKMVSDWGGMQQKAVVSTMSGKPDAQIFVLEPSWAMAMRARNLLAPLPDSIRNPKSVGKNPAGKDGAECSKKRSYPPCRENRTRRFLYLSPVGLWR